MLNVQLQELKNDLFFKGEDFKVRACLFDDKSSYFLVFECVASEESYTLRTQLNKVRSFKSLDSAFGVLVDLERFNELSFSLFSVDI